VRARLAVLSELPQEWGEWVRAGRALVSDARGQLLDPATEYLLWQTAVGAWPIDTARLQTYATKAVREAKARTTWTDPDGAYEADVAALVTALTARPQVAEHIESWLTRTASAARGNILGQKLLQLVLPGVPDVYQGSELVDLALVDPDNRRPVDFAPRRERLARLDAGAPAGDLDDEKLLVTSRTLRLRRDHPQWFTGAEATYAAVPSSSAHALAVGRGDDSGVQVVAVATRLSERLAADGGWGDATLELPAGRWLDLFTGRDLTSEGAGRGEVRLRDLLADLPVALIVRHERA